MAGVVAIFDSADFYFILKSFASLLDCFQFPLKTKCCQPSKILEQKGTTFGILHVLILEVYIHFNAGFFEVLQEIIA